MKRKIKFGPQEFAAVIVEAVASAYLVGEGIPAEQAILIATSLAGVTKGISLQDGSSADTILQSLEKASYTVLYDSSIELPYDFKEILKEHVLEPKKILRFMCQMDTHMQLKTQILRWCERDPNCDSSTFPVDDLVTEIIDRFEQEVLENHDLAAYATYCMLRKREVSTDVSLANQQYIKSFTEPLFLHKDIDGTRVNLSNLFVLQKYQYIRDQCDAPRCNLEEMIANYLREEDASFLFVEGDAGSGKTTLIAWMNYHYSLGDETATHMFNNRPLLTIRLRDLNKEDLEKNRSLSYAICKYMNIPSLDDLERLFPNAIMLLDGFDELCMIEGVAYDHEKMLYDLHRKNLRGFKFIVTTRPKFISYGIDIPSEYISLKHFDAEQRERWLEHYTSDNYCGQKLDEAVYEYIKNISEDTSSCICDTPMTLYMLAAKQGTVKYLENNWALYHHIFYEELSETKYNKMFPNPDRNYSHEISRLRDVLYRVSEEIAYHMYQKNNQSFYLSEKELSSIIEKLSGEIPILRQADMQSIAEHCYALCCYWKANSDRGAVEFLHNNIRDFFLAEKIYREMDDMTTKVRVENNHEILSRQIAEKLCVLFQYGVLETKVAEFIFLRALYQRQNNKFDFAKYEHQNSLVRRVITYLSREGLNNSGVLADNLYINLVEKTTNILTCTVQIYRHAYEAHLRETDLIPWTPQTPFYSSILRPLFKDIFCQVPVTISSDYMITLGSRGWFNGLDFRSSDLRNIGFQGSNISNTNFSDAILCGCDFAHAILDGSDFTNADIHYASLQNTSLVGCNMTGADLRGTELPDGYVSANQSEQVEHMKYLRISGLII